MLVSAFLDEAVEEIADEGLQDVVRAEVARWMARRSGEAGEGRREAA